MKRNQHTFAIVLLVIFSSLATQSIHAAWDNIAKGAYLCDSGNSVCFSGRIDMERNEKIIEINGRLAKTNGEGELIFEFYGTTPLDESVSHRVSIPVRGKYSETIDYKFGPPYSNRTEWQLANIYFE